MNFEKILNIDKLMFYLNVLPSVNGKEKVITMILVSSTQVPAGHCKDIS